MDILALDLGSSTGFCYNIGESHSAGTKTWATDRELRQAKKERLDRRGDIRVIRFFEWMKSLPTLIEAVVFEDVQFHTSLAQSQLWSSFRASVWLAFPHKTIECVPVGTLKKFATGNGAATKEQMQEAYYRSIFSTPKTEFEWGLDDNGIDAVWLWIWAQQNLGKKTL